MRSDFGLVLRDKNIVESPDGLHLDFEEGTVFAPRDEVDATVIDLARIDFKPVQREFHLHEVFSELADLKVVESRPIVSIHGIAAYGHHTPEYTASGLIDAARCAIGWPVRQQQASLDNTMLRLLKVVAVDILDDERAFR